MKTYEFPNQPFPVDKIKEIWPELIVEGISGHINPDTKDLQEIFIYKNFDVYENYDDPTVYEETNVIYMVNSEKLYVVVEESEEILKILEVFDG